MIISETPLRMSFVGGGSDLPAFYRAHGGAVISTAIDKYVYVTVNKKFDDWIRVSYSKTEEVRSVAELEHKIVRASLNKLGITGGVEITSVADIPSRGTGLGSSSSFTVGLLHTLSAYQGRYMTAGDLAADSCSVEIDLCGERIGKQDQYAAAYGGFNMIRFNPDDSVIVEPVICRKELIQQLESSIIVFYTGMTRRASSILATQSQHMEDDRLCQRNMLRMVQLAHYLRQELQNHNLAAFGEILHENWVLKRSLVLGISCSEIDECYERGRAAGATGGKLLGAGGGGFLMFYAAPECHLAIERALPGMRRVSFHFEPRGSRIILFH